MASRGEGRAKVVELEKAEEERDELDRRMKEAKVEEERLKEQLEKVELRMERFEDSAWDWDRQELEKVRENQRENLNHLTFSYP